MKKKYQDYSIALLSKELPRGALVGLQRPTTALVWINARMSLRDENKSLLSSKIKIPPLRAASSQLGKAGSEMRGEGNAGQLLSQLLLLPLCPSQVLRARSLLGGAWASHSAPTPQVR